LGHDHWVRTVSGGDAVRFRTTKRCQECVDLYPGAPCPAHAVPLPALVDPSAMGECSWCEEMTPASVRQENEGMCFRCWRAWAIPEQLKARKVW
jgi:hypothetical protein